MGGTLNWNLDGNLNGNQTGTELGPNWYQKVVLGGSWTVIGGGSSGSLGGALEDPSSPRHRSGTRDPKSAKSG